MTCTILQKTHTKDEKTQRIWLASLQRLAGASPGASSGLRGAPRLSWAILGRPGPSLRNFCYSSMGALPFLQKLMFCCQISGNLAQCPTCLLDSQQICPVLNAPGRFSTDSAKCSTLHVKRIPLLICPKCTCAVGNESERFRRCLKRVHFAIEDASDVKYAHTVFEHVLTLRHL